MAAGHHREGIMSHWDFSRRPTAGRDPARRAVPPEAAGWPGNGAAGNGAAGNGAAGNGAAGNGAAGGLWTGEAPAGAAGRRPFGLVHDGAGGEPQEDAWDDDFTGPYPVTWERDADTPEEAETAQTRVPPPAVPWEPWPPAPNLGGGQAGEAGAARETEDAWDHWYGGGAQSTRHGRPRWPILAGIVVAGAAVGVAAVQLAGAGQAGAAAHRSQAPGSRASAPSAPEAPSASKAPGTSEAPGATAVPVTLAEAKAVLARYTAANNSANAQRSDALLSSVETGGSLAIDEGLYQSQQGTPPFPAFSPVSAVYYIPRGEPATGPRWFAVQVANAFDSNPRQVTSSEYLLFTQVPGGQWLDAAEPYLPAGADGPQIAVGADGLATAVSTDDAADADADAAAATAVPPGQLPEDTAAALDAGEGAAAPGTLADAAEAKLLQGKVHGGSVTDVHASATGTAGAEYALRTADGGALVFYADAAQLTVTPAAGTALHLSVPGFYSSAQPLSRAGLTYLDQFAAYDPPAGAGKKAPSVVADYSGITGKD
jgi:hypothetical protein